MQLATLVLSAPSPRVRQITEAAGVMVWIAIGLLLMTAAIEHLVWPVVAALPTAIELPPGEAAAEIARDVLHRLILAAPALMLARALYDLRTALAEYEKGELFSLRAGDAVRSAGEWMLWALIARAVISPTLYAFVTHQQGGPTFAFESFDVGLVAAAAFVMLAGRILEAAAALKAEHDQIV